MYQFFCSQVRFLVLYLNTNKNGHIEKQNRIGSPGITHLWAISLRQKRQEYTMEKRQSLQQALLGKLDSHTLNQ